MFNYNNYIGEHMSEPLKVYFGGELMNFSGYMKYISGGKHIEYFRLSSVNNSDYIDVANRESIIPRIKSISDLTDEELLFVYKGSYLIHEEFLHVVSSGGSVRWYCNASDDMIMELDIKTGTWDINTEGMYSIDMQQILNRLYSLHCHPNAKELINNNQAVRKP